MKENARQSNFELLRICAMAFITLNHMDLFYHLFSNCEAYSAVNEIINCLFLCGGKFGCNLFLILSVYFLSQSNFKINRVIKLAAQTFFYLILLNVMSIFLGYSDFSIHAVFSNVSSTISGVTYWYSFSYISLLFLFPLFRSLLDSLKHKRLFLLLYGLIIVIIPTFTVKFSLLGNTAKRVFEILNFRYVLLFCFEYCIAYYLRNYSQKPLCAKNLEKLGGGYFHHIVHSYVFTDLLV